MLMPFVVLQRTSSRHRRIFGKDSRFARINKEASSWRQLSVVAL